jgi:hypothetical protein
MIYSLSVAARHEGIRVSVAGEIDMSVSDHLYEVLRDALDAVACSSASHAALSGGYWSLLTH